MHVYACAVLAANCVIQSKIPYVSFSPIRTIYSVLFRFSLEGFRHEIEVKLSYLFRLGVLAYMKLFLFNILPTNTVGP